MDKDPNRNLPKVDFNQAEVLWTSDYWDGAISGMIRCQGELCWFEMTQESTNSKEDGWFRRFAIIKLSKQQLAKEFEVHKDFQRLVGPYSDVNNLWTPPTLEKGKSQEFYDMHSEYVHSRPFDENTVIAWMES